jgi:hypothetical protein
MAEKRPAALVPLGWASLVLGVGWVVWLILGRQEEALDLMRAGSGDAAAAVRLGRRGVAGPGAVQATVLTLALELTMALLWVVAGVALLLYRPFARRTALVACGGAIVIEAVSALLRVFVFTPHGQPIHLMSVVGNGVVTLAAVVLWGALFLPAVEAAYTGVPEAEIETA